MISSCNTQPQGPVVCCPVTATLSSSIRPLKCKGHLKASRLEAKQVFLKRENSQEGNWASGRLFPDRKVLVLDMDETLVHATCAKEGDYQLQVTGEIGFEIGLKLRPFVKDFLLKMSQIYEVVVFTSSQQSYADTVLNFLDPSHTLIHHRFYRQHCHFISTTAYKDLRLFTGIPLPHIIICDNVIANFALQLDNGVPVKTWTGDKKDQELVFLAQYLGKLVGAADVREVNRETFKLARKLGSCNSPL